MLRRWFLVLLFLAVGVRVLPLGALAASDHRPPAVASDMGDMGDGHDDSEDDHGGDDHGGMGGTDEQKPGEKSGGGEMKKGDDDHGGMGGGEKEDDRYDENYAFYGQVRLATSQVVVENRTLLGDDPMLKYLAPGMLLEVKGRVHGNRIEVRDLEVQRPKVWAYYEGPGSRIEEGMSGRVRVWFEGDRGQRIFRMMPVPDGDPTLTLLACYKSGRWQGVPFELMPTTRPEKPGWWLFTGEIRFSQLIWFQMRWLKGC